MTTPVHPSAANVARASAQSLGSIALTVVLAAVTHAYDFGPVAFVAGAVFIALLYALIRHYLRTDSRRALLLYGLLNRWVIIGFGLVGGLWNHAVKAAVAAMHDGAIPDRLVGFFMMPELGSVAYESIGILTFVAGGFAAWFGYVFARAVKAT